MQNLEIFNDRKTTVWEVPGEECLYIARLLNKAQRNHGHLKADAGHLRDDEETQNAAGVIVRPLDQGMGMYYGDCTLCDASYALYRTEV